MFLPLLHAVLSIQKVHTVRLSYLQNASACSISETNLAVNYTMQINCPTNASMPVPEPAFQDTNSRQAVLSFGYGHVH